jgi:hypothetical protein
VTGVGAATSSRTTWTLVIAAIFAYTLATIARNPLWINGDSALHIEAAERILAGGLAHVDAIDTNPPLIMYLSAVPTAIAHAIGGHPVPVFLVVVWLLTVVSTFASRQLLLGAVAPREAIHAHLLGVSAALASCAVLLRTEYGQREHLFVVGVLPYLIVRFRRWELIPTPRAAAITAGIAAGVATSIKPQLAMIVLAPEIYWLISRRAFRPLLCEESVAAVASAAAYLAHFLVWSEVGKAFFGRWLPMVMEGYGAYNGTFESILLWHYAEWQPVAVAILPFAVRARRPDLAWRMTQPLAVAIVASAAVYVLQHKGWTYHAVPILMLAYTLAGLVVAQLLSPPNDGEPDRALTGVVPARVVRLAIGTAVAIAIVGSLLSIGPETRAERDRLITGSAVARAITAHTREGEPVLLLSTSTWGPYPLLVQLRRPQASRFLLAFPVSLLYYGVTREPGQPFPYRGTNGIPRPAEETRFLDDLRVDIETSRPKMVLIDANARCEACPEGFALHEYFERTGFAATALAEYARSANIDRYALYLRRD